MKVRILFDNEAASGYKHGWGFSCLVGGTLLFDVGGNSDTLLFNMRKSQVDFEAIDKVFLSHAHTDHIGGISILKYLGDVKVYIPESFSSNFIDGLRDFGNVSVIKVKNQTKIDEGLYSTGELGKTVLEQSLIVKTENRYVVIVGCSHPGIDDILKEANKIGKITGIVGGFHDYSRIEELSGFEIISSCHCTSYKKEIKLLYQIAYRDCGVGSTIHI
ncbi:MBL fold metallo-hydrolase [Candidatus Bathyarchaeota archaeon]|nr:MBL fold metallo-hydrolase [Candidatus Bathyarchaeota archaeon]